MPGFLFVADSRRMANLAFCPICRVGPQHPPDQIGGGVLYDCSNCGPYWLTGTAAVVLPENIEAAPERRFLLAHFVRQRSRAGERTKVDSHLVQHAFATSTAFPSAFEQLENLLIWLAQNTRPGQLITIEFRTFQAIVGSPDELALRWVALSAHQRGFVHGYETSSSDGFRFEAATLTLEGWTWFDDIGRHKRSRIAFMAMQFNDPTLDKIVNDHFRRAVERTGFTLRRLDDQPRAGIIDNILRVEIRRARVMICDLTHRNPGAYWEAGFAEGIGIPVVYTCEHGAMSAKTLHFDTRNCTVVPWTEAEPEKAADMLTATIRNSLPDEAKLED